MPVLFLVSIILWTLIIKKFYFFSNFSINRTPAENIKKTALEIDKDLNIIAVLTAIAPLLGLLGTVTGMIKTFDFITISGAGDAARFASGIKEALFTTEFGLVIAIPCYFFSRRLNSKSYKLKQKLNRLELGILQV